MASRDGKFSVDIECGGTTSEEEGIGDVVSGNSRGRRPSNRGNAGDLSYNGFTSSVIDVDKNDSFSKLNDFCGGVEFLIDKNLEGDDVGDLAAILEKKNPSEQWKKQVPKNASKPPRPPKGPLLTALDLKLVKEFSEIAARKRARIEQIKEFRKVKESKKASPGSSIVVMVITVLFFIVIVLQGIFSGHGFTRNFRGLLHQLH